MLSPYPIYLLRHGETEWNREDRRQGRLGSSLTDKGVGQAHAMGETLVRLLGDAAGNWTLVSSPQQRAVQSATIIADILGKPFTIDDRLMEMGMGSWEGLTWPEIEARWPGVAGPHDTAHLRIPDGEGYRAVANRALSWLQSIDRPTIAVSHGVFARILRTVYLGLGESEYPQQAPAGQDGFLLLDHGTISRIPANAPSQSIPSF